MEIDELTSIIYLVAFGMLLLLGLAVIIMQLSSKKILKEKLQQEELKTNHKKELMAHAIITQEKERDRLAAEIHDDITSKLNIIHIHLESLEKEVKPELRAKIEPLHEVVKSGIVDSRRIAYDLFPVILEKFGLLTALEELRDLNSNKKVRVKLETSITDQSFAPEVAVHIYRIVQELFNNSVKYAHCSEIALSLSLEGNQGYLSYSDNGVGEAKKIKDSKGMGFKNINSRLSVLDGALEIKDASPGLLFEIQFKSTLQ